MIHYILALVSGILVLGADQLTKYYIISNFELGDSAEFINGLIDIQYIHNRGAAWGMLSGKTWILLVVTVLVMALCIMFLIKTGNKSRLMLWAMSLVISGGFGNMIDRVFRDGNVIDFLHFEFWPSFPVFNVADCAIVIGAGLLLLYFLLESVKEYRESKQGEGKNADN